MPAQSILSSDPIAALATPPGQSALGIVRMSGDGVWTLAAHACGHKSIPESWAPRTAQVVTIRDSDGDVLDEGVLLPWKGPHSSTGEDLVEFIGHGSPAALTLVLERFLALGARPAKPGEFTRRGFINGKLTLDQAESVASLIDAKTGAAARSSLRVLMGGLKTQLQMIEESLQDALGLVELELDFAEEEIPIFNRDRFVADVAELLDQLERLSQHARASKYLRNGIHVVIAGETNAGKSTLFNQWLGQERAIVSATPGTTRDYLDAAVDWNGIPVRLVDTAGLRLTEEAIEKEGIRRAQALLEQADVLLWLVSPPDFVLPDERYVTDERLLLIRNKADVGVLTPETLSAKVTAAISATTGDGLDDLQARIVQRLMGGTNYEESLGLEQRHARHLNEAAEALGRSSTLASANASEELIAVEIRAALDALSEITGRIAGDDVLNRIFGRFCIGK
ncbi:tRNA uridine-5-carboxymethylaminomethyl(34) synthesis GTPase MnmE [bacterium]|nr:tRNA uridine-5-carboxymethylaminomethyl(34) synthesis GTPase MnmE [bacterium]